MSVESRNVRGKEGKQKREILEKVRERISRKLKEREKEEREPVEI